MIVLWLHEYVVSFILILTHKPRSIFNQNAIMGEEDLKSVYIFSFFINIMV